MAGKDDEDDPEKAAKRKRLVPIADRAAASAPTQRAAPAELAQ